MTERMLLEALLEKYGFETIIDMIGQICDAKCAEMVAYGDTNRAKVWANHSEFLNR